VQSCGPEELHTLVVVWVHRLYLARAKTLSHAIPKAPLDSGSWVPTALVSCGSKQRSVGRASRQLERSIAELVYREQWAQPRWVAVTGADEPIKVWLQPGLSLSL